MALHRVELAQPCQKCRDQCPGWMAHLWRKKCVSCDCPLSAHINSERDIPNVASLTLKQSNEEQKLAAVYDWYPPNTSLELVELYMKSLPSEWVPLKGSAGALRRIKQYTKQLPAHDYDCGACHNMTDLEKRRLVKFVEKRRNQAEGRGRLEMVLRGQEKVCASCSAEIPANSVCVVTERVGPAKAWHSACFKCTKCNEQLVDLVYFTNDQQTIYCGRHHGELIVPRCAGCDELIFASTYTNAEGKSWHKEHFCCCKCDEPLVGKTYATLDDNVYCETCHAKQAVTCYKCTKPIGLKSKKVTVQERSWHDTCFICYRCRKDLQHCRYFEIKDNLVCAECLEPVTQCYKCKKGINKAVGYLTHGSRSWHSDCFKCVLCHTWLIDGQFHDYDDELMCDACYAEKVGKRCGACGRSITANKAVQHGLSFYHTECFKCAGCGCSFEGGGKVKEKDGKPYCLQCLAEQAARCFKCQRPILGRHTIYNKRLYHLECFVCSNCGTSLGNTKVFYETSQDTVLCTACADQ